MTNVTPNVPGNRAFVLKKLHSLTGLMPVGLFLLEHIFSNAYSLRGPEPYNEHIRFLTSLPFLFPIEICFIFLPLFFHGVLGMMISFEGSSTVRRMGNSRNWVYLAQRWTGVLTLGFLVLHLLQFRFAHGLTPDPTFWEGAFEQLNQFFRSPMMLVIYLLGLFCACFHFANGLALMGITWGVTLSKRSQDRTFRFCMGFGLLLFVVGAAGILPFLS